MRLTGPQISALVEAMLAAFSLDELRLLLSARLDQTLDDITGGGPRRSQFHDVVRWFNRRHRLPELAEVMAEERPHDPRLAAFARSLALAADAPVGEPSVDSTPKAPPSAEAQRETRPQRQSVAADPAALLTRRLLRPLLGAADEGDLPQDVDEFVLLRASDTLGYDFYIGKYPVTNAQFRRFVDDGGYAKRQPWWTSMAEEVWELDQQDKHWRDGPRFWSDIRFRDRFSQPAQPVVDICWYEARAYCAWLTIKLRATKSIKPDEEVRLPTLAEWERAARSTLARACPPSRKTPGGNQPSCRRSRITPAGGLPGRGAVWQFSRRSGTIARNPADERDRHA